MLSIKNAELCKNVGGEKRAETNLPPSPPSLMSPGFLPWGISPKFSQTANSSVVLKVKIKTELPWNWFMRDVILLCVVTGCIIIPRVKGEYKI